MIRFQIDSSSGKRHIGFPVFALGCLIASYFYCLPLGEYSVAFVVTDYRLYDFVFLGFLVVFGAPQVRKLHLLWMHQQGFFRWSIFLLYLVWMSTGATTLMSDRSLTATLYTALRAFRFTNYLIIGGFIIIFVNTPRRYRFILYIIYVNIAIQSILAFAQGLGVIDTFWPARWTATFGEVPVGTLSPHHMQIAIVMLLGMGITIALLHETETIIFKSVLVLLFAIMLAVPVFAGTRTAWVSVVGLIAIYFYLYRSKGILGTVLICTTVFLLFWVNQDLVQQPLQVQLDNRLILDYQDQGIYGIYGDRLDVYRDIIRGMTTKPWLIVTGTGFQNAVSGISNSGAHNGYLHAWVELGILGFIVYLVFLGKIWQQLRQVIIHAPGKLERVIAQGAWMAYGAVLVSMLAGESLWAQYSMFTLTGQIIAVMALAIAPLYWDSTQANSSATPQQFAYSSKDRLILKRLKG